MKVVRVGWVAALLAAGGGAAPATAEVINEVAPLYSRVGGAVSVPAELLDRVLFVRVFVNGRGPFRVFVDTGCSVSIVSPELAAAVGARPPPGDGPASLAVNSLGHSFGVPQVLLDSVVLGGVRFEGVTAGVLPLDSLAQVDGTRIDGLLGFSLFADVVVGLDYPGHRLLIGSGWPQHLPPLRAELPLHEYNEVPFVDARLQDRAFELEIDSGSNGNLHLPGELATTLTWKAEPRPGSMVEAMDEESRDYLGRVNGRLTLGSLDLPEPVASIGGPAPSIGYDVLGRFCVVFDQRADKVRFYSAQAGPFGSPPERSVGLSLKVDPAGWRVARVIPGSPAEEARLTAGDLVTRIEGRPAGKWSRNQLQDWVQTHRAMNLRVVRGGSARDVRLRVWLLVP